MLLQILETAVRTVVLLSSLIILFVVVSVVFRSVVHKENRRLTKMWDEKIRQWFFFKNAENLFEYVKVFEFDEESARFAVHVPYHESWGQTIDLNGRVTGSAYVDDFMSARESELQRALLFFGPIGLGLEEEFIRLLQSGDFGSVKYEDLIELPRYKPLQVKDRVYFEAGVSPEVMKVLRVAKFLPAEYVIQKVERRLRLSLG